MEAEAARVCLDEMARGESQSAAPPILRLGQVAPPPPPSVLVALATNVSKDLVATLSELIELGLGDYPAIPASVASEIHSTLVWANARLYMALGEPADQPDLGILDPQPRLDVAALLYKGARQLLGEYKAWRVGARGYQARPTWLFDMASMLGPEGAWGSAAWSALAPPDKLRKNTVLLDSWRMAILDRLNQFTFRAVAKTMLTMALATPLTSCSKYGDALQATARRYFVDADTDEAEYTLRANFEQFVAADGMATDVLAALHIPAQLLAPPTASVSPLASGRLDFDDVRDDDDDEVASDDREGSGSRRAHAMTDAQFAYFTAAYAEALGAMLSRIIRSGVDHANDWEAACTLVAILAQDDTFRNNYAWKVQRMSKEIATARASVLFVDPATLAPVLAQLMQAAGSSGNADEARRVAYLNVVKWLAAGCALIDLREAIDRMRAAHGVELTYPITFAGVCGGVEGQTTYAHVYQAIDGLQAAFAQCVADTTGRARDAYYTVTAGTRAQGQETLIQLSTGSMANSLVDSVIRIAPDTQWHRALLGLARVVAEGAQQAPGATRAGTSPYSEMPRLRDVIHALAHLAITKARRSWKPAVARADMLGMTRESAAAALGRAVAAVLTEPSVAQMASPAEMVAIITRQADDAQLRDKVLLDRVSIAPSVAAALYDIGVTIAAEAVIGAAARASVTGYHFLSAGLIRFSPGDDIMRAVAYTVIEGRKGMVIHLTGERPLLKLLRGDNAREGLTGALTRPASIADVLVEDARVARVQQAVAARLAREEEDRFGDGGVGFDDYYDARRRRGGGGDRKRGRGARATMTPSAYNEPAVSQAGVTDEDAPSTLAGRYAKRQLDGAPAPPDAESSDEGLALCAVIQVLALGQPGGVVAEGADAARSRAWSAVELEKYLRRASGAVTLCNRRGAGEFEPSRGPFTGRNRLEATLSALITISEARGQTTEALRRQTAVHMLGVAISRGVTGGCVASVAPRLSLPYRDDPASRAKRVRLAALVLCDGRYDMYAQSIAARAERAQFIGNRLQDFAESKSDAYIPALLRSIRPRLLTPSDIERYGSMDGRVQAALDRITSAIVARIWELDASIEDPRRCINAAWGIWAHGISARIMWPTYAWDDINAFQLRSENVGDDGAALFAYMSELRTAVSALEDLASS